MLPERRPSRVIIDRVLPEIDGGRFPIKRVVGDPVQVRAHVFADGHDVLAVEVLDRTATGESWSRTPMVPRGNDEWDATFPVREVGTHLYTVRAQIDRYASWRRDTRTKISAGQDVRVELMAGAALLEGVAAKLAGEEAKRVAEAARAVSQAGDAEDASEVLADDALFQLLARIIDEASVVTYERELRVTVDPELAGFSAWYELFPRSTGAGARKHGTFNDVIKQLDRVAEMGFDVLYLPPIHPIGAAFRKGKNNTLKATKGDVGSPWAIGSAEGGHKAIHPQLGTMEDFERLVAEADRRKIAVALDIAFQCSPDHPYLTEHPEWFKKRPDGTIQYAENPPKKYQDIYPFDFECEHWADLWTELKSIFDFWIGHGVYIFRVDNPHTKALPFWEWAIPAIKAEHPEVLFLSEAFTRPKVMYRLAKLGFSQSYTYFTWRNRKWELEEYLTELTQTEVVEYFRPNLWPNTPDILHEYLQSGGKPAFMARLILAATLSGNYGMYGPAFELVENVPIAHGSEEYLHSEKYEVRKWDLARTEDNLTGLVSIVNHVRRANPALHRNASLAFHPTDNSEIIAYSKRDAGGDNAVLVVVNLDSHYKQSGWVSVDLSELGVTPDLPYQVEDLLTGDSFLWEGSRNYVELDPLKIPAHIFLVHRRVLTEQDFNHYA